MRKNIKSKKEEERKGEREGEESGRAREEEEEKRKERGKKEGKREERRKDGNPISTLFYLHYILSKFPLWGFFFLAQNLSSSRENG